MAIERLPTGIAHLDAILGGGIPKYSTILIAGPPGTGKTVLTHQVVFHNATPEHPALIITTLSEPLARMVQFMQQFAFFDTSQIQQSVFYEDVGPWVLQGNVEAAMEAVLTRVKEIQPALLVIDSIKAFLDVAATSEALRRALYRLAATLATLPCTAFLVGEFVADFHHSPTASIVDGIIELRSQPLGVSERRTLQVHKLRGSTYVPGEHTYLITEQGIRLFPRFITPPKPVPHTISTERVPTGINGLDAMLHGGLLKGTSVLLAGDPGVGKTVTALHFLLNGAQMGDAGIYLSFQEDPYQLRYIARNFGFDVERLEQEGRVRFLYQSPVEINPDALALTLIQAVEHLNATRVVIDSIRDLEAGTYHDPYRFFNYVYSLVQWFKDRRVTVLLTSEIGTMFGTDLTLTGYGISHIADTLVVMRYAPTDRGVTRVMAVLAARGSAHSHEVREFRISEADGVVIGDVQRGSLILQDYAKGDHTRYEGTGAT